MTTNPAAAARTRAQVWWLLARLLATRPDAAFIAELRECFPAPGVGAHGPTAEFATAVHGLGPEELVALGVEYTRLFRGIQRDYGPPPPYESLYRGAELMGAPALAVRAAYAAAGLPGVVPVDGLPDGIATELRFLALLCFQEAEAWADGDAGAAGVRLDQQRQFLDQHLLAWLPAWVAHVGACARAPMYRSALALTLDFAESARAELDHFTTWVEAA